MPQLKEKIAIGISAGLLATGFVTALQPPSPRQTTDDRDRHRIEQDVGNLVDQDAAVHEQMRRDGDAIGQADYEDRLRPGEHRPPEPHVRVRLP